MVARSTQFQPGHSGGPGRPKGARNKFGEDFVTALAEDFEKHGADVIAKVREEKPEQYLRVIVQVLPKEIDVIASASAPLTSEPISATARWIEETLGRENLYPNKDTEDAG